MVVQICMGSSCHIKGSEKIVEMFRTAVAENRLGDRVTLVGGFCPGKCNRFGVSVTLDGTVYTGITAENFRSFFNEKILKPALGENA